MDRPVTGPAEWQAAMRSLGLPAGVPVIAHASLSAFGSVEGGPDTVLEALLAEFDTLVMPGFTYATMVTPETRSARQRRDLREHPRISNYQGALPSRLEPPPPEGA